MRAILQASALTSVLSASPADFTFRLDTIIAETNPAMTMAKPPNHADTAPGSPAHTAATSPSASVTYSCQRNTVRKGLLAIELNARGKRNAILLIILSNILLRQTVNRFGIQ